MPVMHERSGQETMLVERVKQISAPLPETTIEVDGFGHTAFRVGGRSFVLVGAGGGRGSLSIKTDPATQEQLVEEGPYIRTPGLGHHGWITVWGDDPLDWVEVTELIREAWQRVAPKRLTRRAAGY